ncbi:hypothetical protein [Streptomyces sp. HUAS TT3]|uniref:hypothetical protein n=1 Tax=Streptomyces sp. HUAS TT3 TaxID=3447510 RepID=UPI003F655441
MEEVLAYVAAGLAGLWGVSHAIPTRVVVGGFAQISTDNRRIPVRERINICPALLTCSAVLLLIAGLA